MEGISKIGLCLEALSEALPQLPEGFAGAKAASSRLAVRQWVCSLPLRLRVHLGYDRNLCADVLEAFVAEVSRSLKRRAKKALGLTTAKQALTG